MLLFPRPSALHDIYWDPACNFKSELYGTGVLGPPQLFSTCDGERHRRLRKALGGAQWSVGALKKTWEPRFDDLINELTERPGQLADRGEEIDPSDIPRRNQGIPKDWRRGVGGKKQTLPDQVN